jgi:hypothetical protein
MSYISRFSVNFSRIIYCVKQNIIKYSNTDIYFTIQNVVYTNNDITFQTNYLFSVFMVIDFFINTNMNNEINKGIKKFFNHKRNIGFKVIDLLNNKFKEIKDITQSLSQFKIYFEVFWTKDKLYTYLQGLINNIENGDLKERLYNSMNYIISYYDTFFKNLNNYIIQMLKFNNINIDLDNILYYFDNYDDEYKEQQEAALILVSLLQDK